MSAVPPVAETVEVSRLHRPGLFSRRPPFRALDRVSLAVRPGEIHGLVGASGSGKSTLARILAMLDRADGGNVRIGGSDVAGLSRTARREIRRDVQMVFQDPQGSLNPRHGVGRSIAEPLYLLPGLSRAERRERVGQAMRRVGLDPADAARRPHAFSGGQRQRVAIARALICRPKLLVADEAVSALDVSVQAQILNLLMDLNEADGLSILFISHDLSVVAALCDRVSVMEGGRIVEHGSAAAVLADPQADYTRRLVASAGL
jgi:peptide/nickel transport system ATP-binding protein